MEKPHRCTGASGGVVMVYTETIHLIYYLYRYTYATPAGDGCLEKEELQ